MIKDLFGRLIIGMTLKSEFLDKMRHEGKEVVYVRKFSCPMDAAAHKHLLDDLSKETLEWIIRKHKETNPVKTIQ